MAFSVCVRRWNCSTIHEAERRASSSIRMARCLTLGNRLWCASRHARITVSGISVGGVWAAWDLEHVSTYDPLVCPAVRRRW